MWKHDAQRCNYFFIFVANKIFETFFSTRKLVGYCYFIMEMYISMILSISTSFMVVGLLEVSSLHSYQTDLQQYYYFQNMCALIMNG